MTPHHKLIIPLLPLPQILNRHPLILLRCLDTAIEIVRQPRVIGGYFSVMNGKGDVDAVGGFVEVVEGLEDGGGSGVVG